MGLNTDLILERNIIFRCFIVHSKTISLQLAAFSGILALYVDNIIKLLYGHVIAKGLLIRQVVVLIDRFVQMPLIKMLPL